MNLCVYVCVYSTRVSCMCIIIYNSQIYNSQMVAKSLIMVVSVVEDCGVLNRTSVDDAGECGSLVKSHQYRDNHKVNAHNRRRRRAQQT